MQNRLHVRNLARDVSAGALQELFEPHGFVVDVKLVTAGKAAGTAAVAFVIMATDESAEAAINALNGSTLHGVVIRVETAREDADDGLRPTEGTA